MKRRKRYSKSPEIILYMIGVSLLTAIVMVWCAQLGFVKFYIAPTKFYIPSEAFLLIVSTLSILGFAKEKSKRLSFNRAFRNTLASYIITLFVYGYFVEFAVHSEVLAVMLLMYFFAAFIVSFVLAFMFCNKRTFTASFWQTKTYYA